MAFIITHLVDLLVQGPAEGRLRVREFLAALKRHVGDLLLLFVLWSGCCLFGTFHISILNFIHQTNNSLQKLHRKLKPELLEPNHTMYFLCCTNTKAAKVLSSSLFYSYFMNLELLLKTINNNKNNVNIIHDGSKTTYVPLQFLPNSLFCRNNMINQSIFFFLN